MERTNARINEYALSTEYDVDSGTFTQIALTVFTQSPFPRDFIFNNDGSILYVLDSTDDEINAYPLDTNYDINSYTSGTSIVLSVSGQDSVPTAMRFNEDGSSLYLAGQTNNKIFEYPLPTPYDIDSYTSGVSEVLNFTTEETAVTSIIFNSDGSILYLTGFSGDDINEYPLSIPFDISSSTGTSVALNISTQENQPQGLLYNEDGSKLYILGRQNVGVSEYQLAITETYSGTVLSTINND